jgi:arsenate reductase
MTAWLRILLGASHDKSVSMHLFHVLKERRARVLFVCLGNTYRSKMAETFANAYGNDVIEADSAGFTPAAKASQTAQRLMMEKGLAMAENKPRRWSPAELDGYDLIVNLCEYGLPKTPVPVLKIPVPDPVGKPEEERREIRDHIEVVVRTMLEQFRQPREEWPWNMGPVEEAEPENPATLFWWRSNPSSVQSPVEGLPV